MSNTDPITISRDELLHAVTVAISKHRELSTAAKLRIAQAYQDRLPVVEAEDVTDQLLTHVQIRREAGPR